jgi:hypothetical protein
MWKGNCSQVSAEEVARVSAVSEDVAAVNEQALARDRRFGDGQSRFSLPSQLGQAAGELLILQVGSYHNST